MEIKALGLHNGVVCSEWVLYESAGNVLEEGRRAFPSFPTSVLVQGLQFPFMTELCRVWQVPKAPAWQREITRSAIPTLVIAGSFDAITSVKVAEAAARPLAKVTLVVIPGVGHFVVPKSPCAQRVMASFLATPDAPDLDCVAALRPPPFTVVPR
jgi:pimeloyl-ACP methyl ester carboxylesterase